MSELDKMEAALNSMQSQTIGEFLDWLTGQGYEICTCFEPDTNFKVNPSYIPLLKTTEALLAEYFDINLAKVEKEKRQLLEKLRRESENA